jgi:YHS domain-containing protein
MFRAIFYLIAFVLIVSVLRSVIGIVSKAAGDFVKPQPPQGGRPVPSGGELKKDPVCGTFISTSTALHKKVRDTTYYFCSPECRDKFR